jgi:hypothetical protein
MGKDSFIADDGTVKLPGFIVTAALTALLGLQAWSLCEIVNLKTDVASIKATLAADQQLTRK